MKTQLKRILSSILAVGMLASMSGALAADASTVHADHYGTALSIYYESGQNVIFVNEPGKQVYPIGYNGTVYLPVRTAGEWLGKEVSWDQETLTVTLSGSVDAQIRSGSAPEAYTEEEYDVIRTWNTDGVDVQLRPDITVTLDGVEQTFTNVNGDVVYPIAWNGTVYLPVRSIGELCGKEVYYVSVVAGRPTIYLRQAMTEAEKQEILDYLDQGAAISERMTKTVRMLNPTVEEYDPAINYDDTARGLELLKSILADLVEAQQLAKPSATYFDRTYQTIQDFLEDAIDTYTGYIKEIEEDGKTLEELKEKEVDSEGILQPALSFFLEVTYQTLEQHYSSAKDRLLMAY